MNNDVLADTLSAENETYIDLYIVSSFYIDAGKRATSTVSLSNVSLKNGT